MSVRALSRLERVASGDAGAVGGRALPLTKATP
jgi:hypothetical protein